MGRILAHLGDHLQPELTQCLPIMQDRLKNEITRLTAVKALTTVANSHLNIDLSPILSESMPVLAGFLRKNQRALKLGTLILIETLVRNYPALMSLQFLSPVLTELPPLLNESDLHIAQLTMTLIATVAKVGGDQSQIIASSCLPEVLKLAKSPLLQGAALSSMLELFRYTSIKYWKF